MSEHTQASRPDDIFSSSDDVPYRKLRDYAADKLSGKDKHEVEKFLLDSELGADLVEGARKIGDDEVIQGNITLLQQALADKLSQPQAAKTEQAVPLRKPGRRFYYAAAAVAVLMSSLLLLTFNRDRDQNILADYLRHLPLQNAIDRSAVDSDAAPEAYRLYEAQDYEAAEAAFRTMSESEEAERYLYLGISQIFISKAEAAIASLSKATAIDDKTAISEHARWYLALALAQNGDLATATETLKSIIADNEQYMSKARALLRDLE